VLDQHQSHLVSTYTTVLQHFQEIRQAAAGRSPGGGRVTPLPKPAQEALSSDLDQIAARLEQIVSSLAPDWRRSAQGGGPGATRMWISVLLRTVEELIEDLLPDRMSKRYGALAPEEAERLARQAEQVLALLRQTMRRSDSAG
jgi:ElaB/YqjD/DUF883 family membrane-anchored ribosome-binding protein